MNAIRSSDSNQLKELAELPWCDPVLSKFILSAYLPKSHSKRTDMQKFLTLINQLADIAWYRATRSITCDDPGIETTTIHFIFGQKSGYKKVDKDPSIMLDSKRIKLRFWRSILYSAERLDESTETRLFIKNLSRETNQQEVEVYLSRFGQIQTIHRFFRPDSKPTRFAMVIFKDSASARKCLQSNHPKINGFKLKIRPLSENKLKLKESLEKIKLSLNQESFILAESITDIEFQTILQKLQIINGKT